MTGKELIHWIKTNGAEDKEVEIYVDGGYWEIEKSEITIDFDDDKVVIGI